jgi:beta-barrel assembly-enhancing protease
MKLLLNMIFYLLVLLFLPGYIIAQPLSVLENVEVTDISIDKTKLVAEKEGDEFEFILTSDSKVKSKKGKALDMRVLHEGMLVDIHYELADAGFVIRKMVVSEEKELQASDCNGFFDNQIDSIAFIGGKRVVLAPGVYIKGKDDKSCKCKGYVFKSFEQKPLTFGYYMTIDGKLRPDGILIAKKVTACKNTASELVAKAITAVSEKFEGGNLKYNRLLGVYKGSISAGGVNYTLHPSEALQEYVVSVGDKVMPGYIKNNGAETIEGLDLKIFVIDSDLPESFSWPNGMIFINTGLLRNMDNEAQLAFILAREIAHICYNHTALRVQKAGRTNKRMEIIKNIFTKGTELIESYKSNGDTSSISRGEIEKILNRYADLADKSLGITKNKQLIATLLAVKDQVRPIELIGQYSRFQELQADEVAMSYLYIAGYDVREAVKFWQSQLAKIQKPGFSSFLAKGIKKIVPSDIMNTITGDIKTAMVSKLSESLINGIFESIFNAPKLARQRLDKASRLILQNYPDIDFDKFERGEKKFKSLVSHSR